MGICICEVMGRAPPPKKKAEPTRWGSLFAVMSSSPSDTFSPSPASGSASGSASSASPPNDFFDMEEINVDAVPVEERPYYVLRAELQRAIALLCFTPHAGRYVQPHVPRLFLEAMLPARLFKKRKSKDTVVMRAVNTRLGVPRRTAAEARDDTTPSRYVGSFGTVYRHLQIRAPTAEDRGQPPEGAPKEQREKWEVWKLLEHPPEELLIPPQNVTEHVKAAFALNKAIRQMAFHHALVLAYANSCPEVKRARSKTVVDTMPVLVSMHSKNEYLRFIVCDPFADMVGASVVSTSGVQIVGVLAPMFHVGEHVTIDDKMRPGQFLRRVRAPAGDAFDTSVEPIVETDGGLYAIELALCHTPPEGVVVRKWPAEVLGIARFFEKRGIPRVRYLWCFVVLVQTIP